MKSILVALTCPRCGYITHKKSETFVNPLFEPECRKELLQLTFFAHDCPNCHKHLEFVHDCLYVDQKKHFMILLKVSNSDPITQQKQPQIHIMRRVDSAAALMEKIRIFDSYLNDYAMERLKYRLKKGHDYTDIRFQEFDEQTQILWFEVQRNQLADMIGVEESFYRSLLPVVPSISSHEFETVDESWAVLHTHI